MHNNKEEHFLETENYLGRVGLERHCTEFLKNSQWCKGFDKNHDCSASDEHFVFVKGYSVFTFSSSVLFEVIQYIRPARLLVCLRTRRSNFE